MRLSIFIVLAIFIVSCKNVNKETSVKDSVIVEDTIETTDNSFKDFREFKVLDSKYIDNKTLWNNLNKNLEGFTDEKYSALKPLILEADIPTLQQHIQNGDLSYELLTKFYLYRIRKFDRDNDLSLNSVISLNPDIITEAKQKDIDLRNRMLKHPIFGMPILLKDNINTLEMPTTAGAVALQNNRTEDAFIVTQLKNKGALILGKANLSEWAYFFCGDCPSGYSAIGGQTLNPYGRRAIDTGGSSSGSGVAVAANFCAAAVGSETAGSILSPASQNATVGLKPTIGLLSRSGIVPISSTLDTPGPITKNVTDNAILLDAMFGQDTDDDKSIYAIWEAGFYINDLAENGLKGKRFGAVKPLLDDTLYVDAIKVLKQQGAEVLEIEAEEIDLPNFLRLLNLDMKRDLPKYLSKYAGDSVQVKYIEDVIAFNEKDSLFTMPYGQKLFNGIKADEGTDDFLTKIKDTLHNNGKKYFDVPMDANQLDGFLSINNYHAAFAAVAEYPAITVPMGYMENGAPKGLTFIGRRLQEKFLLQWAFAFEQASKKRVAPVNYK
ncbi:amidase family protein [Flavivirga spongiicola]|uniref:Amidase family protein n=1 Tax=Flavivirga spongiicola TaxID=421621 RepID=A0ABU7XMJ4_9FLAO|nr:amidase family protein [Flavivirga sp. MEBiC05379]MDO5981643.1 amidase family protein [Flavivirga sp. MEBiC05379]